MSDCPEGITQLQDLLNVARFKEIILAGITTAEAVLDEGEQALQKGHFDQAEEAWKKAFSNLQWVALNVIQRRLKLGKNEGSEIRVRFQNFWKRLMIFGLKKKIAKAVVAANA